MCVHLYIYIYIYIIDLLCCTVETNNIVKQLYLIKLIKKKTPNQKIYEYQWQVAALNLPNYCQR